MVGTETAVARASVAGIAVAAEHTMEFGVDILPDLASSDTDSHTGAVAMGKQGFGETVGYFVRSWLLCCFRLFTIYYSQSYNYE